MNGINTPQKNSDSQEEIVDTLNSEDKSFFQVVVHSFFIVPFLIAIICVLLFTSIKLLTQEKRDAYDYLEDVKIGGISKRWQGAFELSRILANPKHFPIDEKFINELVSVFEHSKGDDDRVRQYLALAMGRTKRAEFLEPLSTGLSIEKEENLPALIYAIGMIAQKKSSSVLYEFTQHKSPRVRSITMASLGEISDPLSKKYFLIGLKDSEPNVQWASAIALARAGDGAGQAILLKLLNRDYLAQFDKVDQNEQNHLIISAIESASLVASRELDEVIRLLSKEDQSMKVRSKALEHFKDKLE